MQQISREQVIGRLRVENPWWEEGGRVPLFFARWKGGEVDLVSSAAGKLDWAAEIKWSDRACRNPSELQGALRFCPRNAVSRLLVTTRTRFGARREEGVEITFVPASVYVAAIGRADAQSVPSG